MLCAVGDLIEDVIVQLHDDVQRDTDTPASISRRRGGSAANVAYFAAKLSGRSRFVGNVGSDSVGDSLIQQLEHAGVNVCGERYGRTGSIVVITGRDGERTMLTDRGDATRLTHVAESWLDDVRVLHVPLYSFAGEPLASASRTALQLAAQRAIRTSIDLSSVTVIAHLGVAAVQGLIESVQPDVVFCTAAEAIAAELTPLARHGAKLLVIKDGPRPVTTCGTSHPPTTHAVHAAQHVIDGTGAGDAFAAGMLTELAQSATWHDADIARGIAAGNQTALHVLGRAGATLEDL